MEPKFVAISQQDERMRAAYAKARETLPGFLAVIRTERLSSAANAVKIRFRDERWSAECGEDRYVFLWLWNVVERDGGLEAEVLELPREGINELAVGQGVRFEREAVHDWMITRLPCVWGAFTMRVIREMKSPDERAQYDQHTGLTKYMNELP